MTSGSTLGVLAAFLWSASALSWAQSVSITEYSVPTSNSGPDGITAGPDGALWFTEDAGIKIGRITTAGVITEFAVPTAASHPYGIAAGLDGALWFAEFYVGKIGRITTSGTVTEFSVPTQPSHPAQIAAGTDGALWFSEQFENKLGRITASGSVTEFVVPTALCEPYGIVAGPDGAQWFTEYAGGKIGRITAAGTITEYVVPTTGSAPLDITVGPDGALWFAEGSGKIGRITTSGTITEYSIPTSGAKPWDIVPGSDGALWFVEQMGNKIGRITTGGVISEYAIPTSASASEGIAVGPDGALWFTELNGNKIGRLSLSQSLTITGISPNAAIAGTSGFTLTVNGTNFANGSVVHWDGAALTTTFISAVQLAAAVPTTLLAVAGNASISVVNLGGTTSNAVTFTINPVGSAMPTISGLSPNSATAASPAFTMAVSGAGFVVESTVQWNGSTLTTSYVNASQLTASVPANLIATSGSASVTVFNPGAAPSNALTFTINPKSACTPSALLLQPISPLTGFSVPPGQPVRIEIAAVDNCGGLTGAATAVFSNGDAELPLTNIGQGNYVGVWVPSNAAQPNVVMTVTVFESLSMSKVLADMIDISGTIQSPTPQQLTTSVAALSFSLAQGGAPVSQPLTILNQGNGTAAFTLSVSGGAWLSVDPISGSVSTGSPVTVTVTVDPSGLAPGTYSGPITIQSGTQTLPPVSVTATVSAAQPILLLSQTALSFTAAEGGGAPLPQDFSILNIGQGSLSWDATASSTGGWLSLSSTSGVVSRPYLDVSSVNVAVNPAKLTAGTYYGQIQVTSPGFGNLLQTISVVLTVLPRGSNPGPEVRPSGLIFAGPLSPSPAAQTVMISNPGAAPAQFNSGPLTLTGVPTWFNTTPASSTVVSGQPAQISIQPNFAQLAEGVTRGTVTLLFDDGTTRNIALLAVVPPASSAGGSLKHDAGGCTPTQLVILPSGSQQALTASVGQPVTIDVRVVDSCGNPLTNATASSAVTVAYSNLDRPGAMVHVGNGRWTTTWQPQRPLPSGTPAVAAVTAFLALSSRLLANQIDIPVTFGAPSGVPIVNSGAVLNAASFAVSGPVAPGSLITIFGANLANGSAGQGASAPLPDELGSTQVMLGGLALPLLYASDGQINAQVPFALPVNIPSQLVVQTGGALSVPEPVLVAPAQPAVFTKDQSGHGQGMIVNGATNVLADANAPVTTGDTIVIYCTGLGAVSPVVPEGTASTGPTPAVMPVSVMIGGQQATVSYAGLTPGFPGLYQVNAVVPSGLTLGPQVLVILSTQGQSSPPVTMALN